MKVAGLGEGVVVALKKKKYGASPHTIRLEASGDAVKVKLGRKWNGKMPWKIADLTAQEEERSGQHHSERSPRKLSADNLWQL